MHFSKHGLITSGDKTKDLSLEIIFFSHFWQMRWEKNQKLWVALLLCLGFYLLEKERREEEKEEEKREREKRGREGFKKIKVRKLP